MARRLNVAALGFWAPSVSDGIGYDSYISLSTENVLQQIRQVEFSAPDLIVLPECCDGSSFFKGARKREFIERRGDTILDAIRNEALTRNCFIAYGAQRITRDGSGRNSLYVIDRSGDLAAVYDKNYLTLDERHEDGFTGVENTLSLDTDMGRMTAAVCFDLNFDALRLRCKSVKPNIILFSSQYHGGLMQGYWAYSCRSYFIGAVSGGECTVVNPLGQTVATSTNYYNYVTASINTDYCVAHLDGNRAKIEKLKSEYGPSVSVYDPGKLGSVLITSQTDAVSAQQMARKFEIEPLDSYFERSNPYNDR